MDLKLMICVAVVAVVSVGAMSVNDHRCLGVNCEYGFEPGYICRCRRFPFLLCDLFSFKTDQLCCPFPMFTQLTQFPHCPPNTRCEARGSIRVCLPAFPTEPLLPNVCELSKETGPCEEHIPRYFYNSATGRCEMFIYGGCHANENNFQTAQECRARCIPHRGYY